MVSAQRIEAPAFAGAIVSCRHHKFVHAAKPGRVTVAGKDSDDLAPGTFNSILKQAGLKGH